MFQETTMPTACEMPLSFNVKLLGKKLFDCKSDLKFDCKSEFKFDCKSELKFDCKSEVKFDCKYDAKFNCKSEFKFDCKSELNLTVNRDTYVKRFLRCAFSYIFA